MMHYSVNNNTRISLVIFLCSNQMISLFPQTASNFRHFFSCGTTASDVSQVCSPEGNIENFIYVRPNWQEIRPMMTKKITFQTSTMLSTTLMKISHWVISESYIDIDYNESRVVIFIEGLGTHHCV